MPNTNEHIEKKIKMERNPFISATATTPAMPHSYEEGNYYNGVGGDLIARTSSFAFPTGHFIWQEYFHFSNIGQHDIVSLWSDEIVMSLKQALEGVEWQRFYPIRIKIDRGCETGFDIDELRQRVVLMVDVALHTIKWESAIVVALKCRDILQEAKIMDVDVEFRQINRHFHAMDVELERMIMEGTLPQYEETNDIKMVSKTGLWPMLSDIGYQIAPEVGTLSHSGTMGLHVKLSGRPGEFYGYTCRHVAHAPAKSPTSKGYWISDGDGYDVRDDKTEIKHRMVQLCPQKLDDIRRDIQHSVKGGWISQRELEMQNTKHKCQSERYRGLTISERHKLELLESVLPIGEKIYSRLSEETFDTPDARAIGHIAVMPPLEVSTEGFLRDWALIRLDLAKFPDLPTNKVYISRDARVKLASAIGDQPELQVFHSLKRDDRGRFRLRGTLPSASCHARKSFAVAKLGAKTDFTCGVTNEIKAAVRIPGGECDRMVAWEWIVISPAHKQGGSLRFSEPGDSGAAVFDAQGRVIGIIGSGFQPKSPTTGEKAANPRLWKHYRADDESLPDDSGRDKMEAEQTPPDDFQQYGADTDLTFITPIDVVLEDVRQATGCDMEIA